MPLIIWLQNGARALMLDTYDFRGDVWLCHSFKGQCHDYTAFVWTFYSLLIKLCEICFPFIFYIVWKCLCLPLAGSSYWHSKGNRSFLICTSSRNCYDNLRRLCSSPKWIDQGLHWCWLDEILVSCDKHAQKWSRLAIS